jgi:probable rRNA maturation factor
VHGTVAIALVSDATMRRLNRQYRGVDKTTDVLSFPEESAGIRRRAARSKSGSAPGIPHLGDIAIAGVTARRQAREQGHSVETELRVLALHGLLHLLGYDHDADRGEMRRIEERLRRRAGLPSGLIGRGRRPSRAGVRRP